MVYLGWDDLLFDYTQHNVARLAEEIRAYQPDVILTHHGPDALSVDHDTTARLVTRAAQVAGAPGLESALAPSRGVPVFFFEATLPLTELEGFNPDFYVNITPVWEKKIAALQCFAPSQPELVAWYTEQAKLRAFQARRLTGRKDILYAEAFERTRPWVGEGLPLDQGV
jgi:4-oxalomesaconate hydratase